MAQEIVNQTGADLFLIESVIPYPTDYTACTEVALEERDSNARPAIAALDTGKNLFFDHHDAETARMFMDMNTFLQTSKYKKQQFIY